MIFILLLFFILIAFPKSSSSNSSALNIARSISDELINSVRQTLLTEIERKGIMGAVETCSEASQRIIQKYQDEKKIYIRRISERYRNRANAPDDYEMKILRKISSMEKIPEEYYEEVQEKDGTYLRYFKTITIQPVCLYCHGKEEIPDEVRKFLKQKYPEDRATGYSPGEFRGAVSVKIKTK